MEYAGKCILLKAESPMDHVPHIDSSLAKHQSSSRHFCFQHFSHLCLLQRMAAFCEGKEKLVAFLIFACSIQICSVCEKTTFQRRFA